MHQACLEQLVSASRSHVMRVMRRPAFSREEVDREPLEVREHANPQIENQPLTDTSRPRIRTRPATAIP